MRKKPSSNLSVLLERMKTYVVRDDACEHITAEQIAIEIEDIQVLCQYLTAMQLHALNELRARTRGEHYECYTPADKTTINAWHTLTAAVLNELKKGDNYETTE